MGCCKSYATEKTSLNSTQVAVGRHVGQVVFKLWHSSQYRLKYRVVATLNWASADHIVSSVFSVVPNFRSSQRCLVQMTGATPKLGEFCGTSTLMFAVFWRRKLSTHLEPPRKQRQGKVLCIILKQDVFRLTKHLHVCPCDLCVL